MKKTLLTLAVLMLGAVARLSAQTPITTWYVIPPTSGCNGIWAIDYTPALCGSTYLFYPNMPQFCGSFMGGVADTMFIQLCMFPCDLTIVDQQGNPCGICGTGIQTGIENSAAEIVTTYPNPTSASEGWNVWLQQPAQNVTVNIYNSLGQLVVTENHQQSGQVVNVDISSLAPGTYSAQVTVNDAPAFTQQLVVTQ